MRKNHIINIIKLQSVLYCNIVSVLVKNKQKSGNANIIYKKFLIMTLGM